MYQTTRALERREASYPMNASVLCSCSKWSEPGGAKPLSGESFYTKGRKRSGNDTHQLLKWMETYTGSDVTTTPAAPRSA